MTLPRRIPKPRIDDLETDIGLVVIARHARGLTDRDPLHVNDPWHPVGGRPCRVRWDQPELSTRPPTVWTARGYGRVATGRAGDPGGPSSRPLPGGHATLARLITDGHDAEWRIAATVSRVAAWQARQAHNHIRDSITGLHGRPCPPLLDDEDLTAITDRVVWGDDCHPPLHTILLRAMTDPDAFTGYPPVLWLHDRVRRPVLKAVRAAVDESRDADSIRQVARSLGTHDPALVTPAHRGLYPGRAVSAALVTRTLAWPARSVPFSLDADERPD